MKCPCCNETMYHRKDRNYHVCPKCFCEVWPSDLTQTEKKKIIDSGNVMDFIYSNPQQSIEYKEPQPAGQAIHKGGGSKCGKRKKKKPKKNVDLITYI